MTWNGTVINNVPTFIYHDELTNSRTYTDSKEPGYLVCTSTAIMEIRWSYPTDASVISAGDFSQNFFHYRVGRFHNPPLRARLQINPFNHIRAPRTDARANGLWRCHELSGPTLHVGIYARVPGELPYSCVIRHISLLNTSFC